MFENTPSMSNADDRMRTMHDGILIGIGTVVNDNPQLNGAYPIMIPRLLYKPSINYPFWQSVISHFPCKTRISSTTTTRGRLFLTHTYDFHPRVSSLPMRRRV
jgi:hypothetical protein